MNEIQRLEYILKSTRAHHTLINSIESHIRELKQSKINHLVNEIKEIDKNSVISSINMWKEQQSNVRHDSEYNDLQQNIDIMELILKLFV